jgi:hypothetical protein
MAKWRGSADVNACFRVEDIEVEADTQEEAEAKIKAEAEATSWEEAGDVPDISAEVDGIEQIKDDEEEQD